MNLNARPGASPTNRPDAAPYAEPVSAGRANARVAARIFPA